MISIKLSTQQCFVVGIVILIMGACHGMNIDQKRLIKSNRNTDSHGVSLRTDENVDLAKDRDLEVIGEVLEQLLENEEDELSSEVEEIPLTDEPLKFFISTKTKTLKTTITSTHSITSYHTCYKANPELPICNRRKRNVKVDRESLLDIRPNLRISLISNDPFREKQNSVDLTWRDVISPTRVARNMQNDDAEHDFTEGSKCQNPGKSIPSPFDSCNICSCSNESIIEGCTKQLCEQDQQDEIKNDSDEKQAMNNPLDSNSVLSDNSSAIVFEEPLNSRNENSPLNLPQDSFGGEWIEREIEGLNRNCYDSGNFANRFITLLMTNLVTQTAFETELVESNQVNTVYFNKNDKQEGCLPADVSEFFTSSCV